MPCFPPIFTSHQFMGCVKMNPTSILSAATPQNADVSGFGGLSEEAKEVEIQIIASWPWGSVGGTGGADWHW